LPKLSDVGLGGYIRDPRNPRKVLRVETDAGNVFICYPVKEVHSTRVVLDTTAYQQLPKDKEVDRVTI